MKKTFTAVRNGDIATVKKILDADPNEISAVAKQPPKKDDGQSLLQVALKSDHPEVASLLLDYHADVNFMESSDSCSDWRMPVLHDAIRCAIMSSRWNSRNFQGEYEEFSTKEKSDLAYSVLKRILELGADISAKDSLGNTCLERAVLDARQLLPHYNFATGAIADDRKVTDALRQDFSRIFKLLYAHGVSSQWPEKISGKPIVEYYNGQPVAEFLG